MFICIHQRLALTQMKNGTIYSSDDELGECDYPKSDDSVSDDAPTTFTTATKPKPIAGANVTRISQHAGMSLVTNHWSRVSPTLTNHTLFVGDVHADINQFIAPLVMTGLITLTGELTLIPNEKAYPSTIYAKSDKDDDILQIPHFDELTLYIPTYVVNKKCASKIIYLGDLVHEWIFGRVVMYILHDLLHQVPENIVFVYGNHDMNVLAIYPLYRRRLINMENIMQTTFNTMAKELSPYKSIHLYRFKVDYNGDEAKGQLLTYAYLAHMFEPLYNIFTHHLGKVSHYVSIDNVPFIASHCPWDLKWIPGFVESKASGNNNLAYLNYSVYSRISEYTTKPDSKRYLLDMHSACKARSGPPGSVDTSKITTRHLKGYEYRKLSEAVNDVVDGYQFLSLSNNIMFRNRNPGNLFVNQITGHTPGGSSWRINGVNPGQTTFYEERVKKMTPESHNDRYLFYWDFNASAGYVNDEFSRPDFIYVDNGRVNSQRYTADEINDTNVLPADVLKLTNLPGFNFILSNGKDSLMIYSRKCKQTGTSQKVVMDPTSSSDEG